MLAHSGKAEEEARAAHLLRHRRARLGRLLPQVPGRGQGLRGRRRCCWAATSPARAWSRCCARDGTLRARDRRQGGDRAADGVGPAGRRHQQGAASTPSQMDADELAGLQAGPGRAGPARSAARSRRRRSGGATLAAERLDPAVRCIITPGNDDPVDADPVYAADERVEFPESERVRPRAGRHGQPGRGAVHAVEHRAGVLGGGPGQADHPSCWTRCPRAGRPS